VQFEAASDNERVIGCAAAERPSLPTEHMALGKSCSGNDSALIIEVMPTAAKEEVLSASSHPCVFFPLAVSSTVSLKTRVWGSSEKTLHCFSATARLSGNSRRGWQSWSGNTAAGSALDANGNTTSKTDSTGTTNYSWDYDNRLTSATLPGSGGTVTFKYDPFGRRIYKSSPSGTSVFVYDGDNLVEETSASGTSVARYAGTDNIDEPLAELRSGTTSYYQADGLGSVTTLSNPAGAIAVNYTYDSFGNIVATSGSIVNNFRYTGREWDAETSLYYYRARYYDAVSGRFINEDPIEFPGGINFYAYVRNDSTNLWDSFGLKDHSEQETLALLQQAYADATAGRIKGLQNIRHHSDNRGGLGSSEGDYDFGWGKQKDDTWTRCGKKMNADQFGNYVAGFQGAAYDHYYFWTTGAFTAQASVEAVGIYYHLTRHTKATNDPWDKTGRPDIRAGERDGWNFSKNPSGCGCAN